MALGKGSILKHVGVFTAREVHVPAWADENGDDVVLVRGMTIREFEINQSRADDGLASASVMSRCIVDENGGRIFEDADTERLAELPLESVKLITQAITEASGLGDNAPAAVQAAVVDAEKNSPPITGDDSSSA